MRAANGRRADRRGMTLIELTIAMSVFLVVGYVLARSVEMGRDVRGSVEALARANADLREVARRVGDDLRVARSDTLTVVDLPGGDQEVTLEQPIVVGGVPDWGVYAPELGPAEEDRNRPDWSVRYTVRESVVNGTLRRDLVRRILDDTGALRREEVLFQGLSGGGTPGFQVVQAGDVWEVRLVADGAGPDGTGRQVVIDVRTRN